MIRLAFLLIALAFPAAAEDWSLLDRPGAVGLMRHALAPGTGDPSNFELRDCGTQRNLDERGRAQARGTGAAIRAAGVKIDAVWSSQWCRCLETAELLELGPVEEKPFLNSFFRDRSSAGAQSAEALMALAARVPDTRVLLVTHQVNITALVGVVPRSGEIIVVEQGSDGALTITGSVIVEP